MCSSVELERTCSPGARLGHVLGRPRPRLPPGTPQHHGSSTEVRRSKGTSRPGRHAGPARHEVLQLTKATPRALHQPQDRQVERLPSLRPTVSGTMAADTAPEELTWPACSSSHYSRPFAELLAQDLSQVGHEVVGH